MKPHFSNLKKLAFSCMSLPIQNNHINYNEFTKIVDIFIDNGFQYFDVTQSFKKEYGEDALKRCLTSRYSRNRYLLAHRLSPYHFENCFEIRKQFEQQLIACGVEYFDFYLIDEQHTATFMHCKKNRAYETVLHLKEEGKIKFFGISFRDKARVLEHILTEYPQIEVVELQFNYADYEDVAVESRKCYEVCRKFGKNVIATAPLKGGCLKDPFIEVKRIFEELDNGSPASYAIRFAESFPSIMAVIAEVNNMAELEESISISKDPVQLSEAEEKAIRKAQQIIYQKRPISCSGCYACTTKCPQYILIPELFACFNSKNQFEDYLSDYYYHHVYSFPGRKASSCMKCGKCEVICPQGLKIRDLLVRVSERFE